MAEQTKIIDVVDVQAGTFRETIVESAPVLDHKTFSWLEAETVGGGRVRRSLAEALVQQPDASNLLRQDFKFLAFTAFSQMPRTIDAFVTRETSTKPEEYYLRDAGMGLIPRTRSGMEAPRLLSSFEGSAVIQNFRYSGAVEVTGDDIRFDRIGKIRQTAALLGRSAAATEESEVYNYITTTTNFTRNSTTGDNDVGANTSSNALSHANFETAMSVIATAKDRKSGMYLGYAADTMIIGPMNEWAVKKLFTSGGMNYGADDETERGTGNPYRGAITRIVVSPFFTANYAWALVDSRSMGVVFQQVEPFNVLQSAQNASNTDWLLSDKIAWVTTGYFGVGMVDDRGWYYSTNSARPTL
jgi:hypothetical protein